MGAAIILVLGVWTFLCVLLGRSTAVTLENIALPINWWFCRGRSREVGGLHHRYWRAA